MKKMFVFFTLLGVAFLIFASEFRKTEQVADSSKISPESSGSTPINISQTATDSDFPKIGIDGNGAAYVIWLERESRRYFYFRTSKGGNWSNIIPVVDLVSGSEEAGFPSFNVTRSGLCHLVFHDARTGYYDIQHIFYDNSWSNLANISNNEGGSAYSSCSVNPIDDYLFVVWMDAEIREWDLFLKYRSPSGSWSPSQVFPQGNGYMPDLAIDAGGTAHLVWHTRSGGSATVWYSRNSNPESPSGWTEAVPVKGATGFEWCSPKIACDNAGNAYVVWIDGTQGNMEIFFRKRKASTGQWEEEINISQTRGISDEPCVAVNKNNGNVFIAWTEENDGKWDIFMESYVTGWSGASNISNNASRSRMPSLGVDPLAGIHLAYTDNGNGNSEIMYLGTAALPPPSNKLEPPLGLTLETSLNPSRTAKINKLNWSSNPDNRDIEIINYKIYRKDYREGHEKFMSIATVSGGTFTYEDLDLPLTKKFTYACTAVSRDDLESDFSKSVTEINTFPPLNVSLSTVTNSSLFLNEKINVISWEKNPLNEAIMVSHYILYRNKVGQLDSYYKWLITLNGNTFEHRDRKLPSNEKYSYVLTAVDSNGYESSRSAAVMEK